MRRSLEQRVLVTTGVVLLGGVCGLLAALGIAVGFRVEQAKRQLRGQAQELIAAHISFDNEARSLLAEMNGSKYPFCSDAEIAYFRKLIFNAEFYRDAGHIRDGRIVCSATLGRDNLPQTQHFPAVSLADGMSLLSWFSPFDQGQARASARQIGDSFVDLEPGISKRLDAITPNRSLTVVDARTHQPMHPGFPFHTPEEVKIDRDWEGFAGATFYATRCDAREMSCITTYTPLAAVLGAWRGRFELAILIGGLLGAFAGGIWAYFRLRDRSTEHNLRQAILKDQLTVVYQPIVDVGTRRVVGAEALVRWTDESGTAISPDVFVKIAEAGGFVGSITRLVVRHALREFAPLLIADPEFRLSINVAAADLSDAEFLPMLERALAGAGVAAESVSIEITESSTARHEVAKETIRRLRERGHSIHIDDFGTGYSSLAYLRDLSIDAIKIDKSFTRAIGTEAVTQSILPQILAMAETLNLHVIVEGVETEAQARYFAAAKQPVFAQGWLFGRPMKADLFLEMLQKDVSATGTPVTSRG